MADVSIKYDAKAKKIIAELPYDPDTADSSYKKTGKENNGKNYDLGNSGGFVKVDGLDRVKASFMGIKSPS